MDEPGPTRQVVRFGVFALDLKAGELRRSGSKVKLQEQPFQVLRLLLERPGDVVTHDEIIHALWPNGTIVEYEHSVKTAVKKLRQALGDDADMPQYVETLPRRGYRFIHPVEVGRGLVAAEPPHQEGPPAAPLPALIPPPVRAVSPGDGAPSAIPPESAPDSSSLIGKSVSHYRVQGEVGKGGMGVVYRAEDIRLGREVALKFLPHELTDSREALERFEREARAASSLNHPNICTIYEVEEHQGRPFIVMELLEGETLRDRLASRTPSSPAGPDSALPLDELLRLGIQIADGLEAAHRKGIIHRDIKPANIFITTGGQAKVLDFGLAKLAGSLLAKPASAIDRRVPLSDPQTPTASIDADHLTRPDAMMGTLAYMSPDQIRGERLDARTDLFSFGLVLYEMATGRQAFYGTPTAAIYDAILNRAPAPITSMNPGLPLKLEEIINRALEKDRDLRYHSAGDLCAELKRLKREKDSARAVAAVYDRREEYGRWAAPLQRHRRFAAGGIALITGVLAFLLRPALPPPRVTGSTQITRDGRNKQGMVTDGSRIYFSSFFSASSSLYQVPATGGDTAPVLTSLLGP